MDPVLIAPALAVAPIAVAPRVTPYARVILTPRSPPVEQAEVPIIMPPVPAPSWRRLRLPPPQGVRSSSQIPKVFQKWSEVPSPDSVKEDCFFLEIFAGSARLTGAMRSTGWNTLPPIDVVLSGLVTEKSDVLDAAFAELLDWWLQSGKVRIMHLGTTLCHFSGQGLLVKRGGLKRAAAKRERWV